MASLQGRCGYGDRAHAAGVFVYYENPQRGCGRLHLHKAFVGNAAGEQVLVGGGFEAQSQRLPLDLRTKAGVVALDEEDVQLVRPASALSSRPRSPAAISIFTSAPASMETTLAVTATWLASTGSQTAC